MVNRSLEDQFRSPLMEPPSSQLTILFEDDWIVAVDKPAGQLVHPAETPQSGDEVTLKILRDQVGQQLHAIHRLDRPTCGVLLFAKGRTATRALSRAFERHQVSKVYWAIINGHPHEMEWLCEEPLQKSPTSQPQTAATAFQVLAKLQSNLALIAARPRTGRYHQIRRHLVHCHHTIVGDYRYRSFQECEEQGQALAIGTRMLLQSKSLTFPHPESKQEMTVTAPTDPLIDRLANSPVQ